MALRTAEHGREAGNPRGVHQRSVGRRQLLGGHPVASGDGRAFREPLEELEKAGTAVTVIGFREHATFALTSEVIEFVDLEDIDGVFREPLPRITLDSLPDTGAWLPPFRSLRSLLEPRR